MKITRKNLLAGLKSQLPLKRALKNFFITRNAWGMFSKNSHISAGTGKEKIPYGSFESAQKAALKMEKKVGVHFSIYINVFIVMGGI